MSEREKRIEAQPIADQIMVSCDCGWREPISVYDHKTVTELWLAAEIAFINHECLTG